MMHSRLLRATSAYQVQRIIVVVLIGTQTTFGSVARGAGVPHSPDNPTAARSAPADSTREKGRNVRNGIVVGDTKVFDDRSLSLKLQALEANLANMQFFDQPSLAAAIGRLQGATQDTSSLAFRASTLPIPGVTTKSTVGDTSSLEKVSGEENLVTGKTGGTTKNTSGSTTGGTTPGTTTGSEATTSSESSTSDKDTSTRTRKQGSTNSVETTITQGAITPTIPILPQQTSAFSLQAPIAVSAQDLLVEQENLNYQVINLRMLLERALSDRYYRTKATFNGKQMPFTTLRPVAVVGFEITIDPQKDYKNAVAEAEITITNNKSDSAERPSLVMQLPREKTYNVASIMKSANAFSLGAVVKVIDVGFAFSKTKERVYLVKDTDTVSLQRIQADEVTEINTKAVTFGWQFRPVLGQSAVTPGTRQVFALLALPNSNLDDFEGKVEVHTRWRKYDAKSRTVGDVIRDSRNSQDLTMLAIPKSTELEGELEPKIESIGWEDAGNGLVLVTVNGANYMTGTNVVLGDIVLDRPANGLVIQAERRLQFITSAQRLASIQSPLILGRYGLPVRLEDPETGTQIVRNSPTFGIQILVDSIHIKAVDAQNSKVILNLAARKNRNLKPELSGRRLIVKVGDQVFLPTNSLMNLDSSDPNTVKVSFIVPTQQLRDTRRVIVRDFFAGNDYIAEAELNNADDFTVTGITTLATTDNKGGQRYALSGSNFTDKVELQLGNSVFKKGDKTHPLDLFGTTMVAFSPSADDLKGVNQLVVVQNNANPVVLPINTPPGLKKPKVDDASSKISITQKDSRRMKLVGENLDSVKEAVTLEGKKVLCQSAADGKSLIVFITSELTGDLGQKDIDFVLKDGSTLYAFTLIVAK